MNARKTYILKLYVAGNTPNSMRALNTLREILESELETLRNQLKSGVEAIALPPFDLDVNEVNTVEIQEVEVEVELEEMKKSIDNS